MYNNYYNNNRIDEALSSNKNNIGSQYIPKNIFQLIKDKNNLILIKKIVQICIDVLDSNVCKLRASGWGINTA